MSPKSFGLIRVSRSSRQKLIHLLIHKGEVLRHGSQMALSCCGYIILLFREKLSSKITTNCYKEPSLLWLYSRSCHVWRLPGRAPGLGVAIVTGRLTDIFSGPRTTRLSFSPVTRTGSVTYSGTLYVQRHES